MRLPVSYTAPFAALALAIAAAGVAQAAGEFPAGPAADYPITVGEPFKIGETTWTPANQLNYDAVGQARVEAGLPGVSAAHKTLPLPSYAEVTSLGSGRTILVRIVERGPMMNETLVGLSSQAAEQLGFAAGEGGAVRIRRVNPPEVERAALRAGGTVPPRMATPEALLKVLRRKLAEQGPSVPPPSVPPSMPTIAIEPVAALPASVRAPAQSKAVKPARPAVTANLSARGLPASKTTSAALPAKGGHVVQVAAFSTRERAEKAAAQLGGRIASSHRYWRVQLGPFGTRGEAAAALEKAKAAGYRDARIQRAD